ncbi:MAG: CHAT domain-containing protein [Pseudomonadota bacterium]
MFRKWAPFLILVSAVLIQKSHAFEVSGTLTSGGGVSIDTPELTPGWYLATVTQSGVDVTLTVAGNAVTGTTVQSLVERFGSEYLAFEVAAAGSVEVELSAPNQQGRFSGKYKLRMVPLSDAQVPLYDSLTAAGRFGEKLDNASRRETIKYLEQALAEAEPGSQVETEILYRLSFQNYWLLELEAAIKHLNALRSREIVVEQSDMRIAVDALMGAILMEQGDTAYQEAEQLLQQSHAEYVAVGDAFHSGTITNNLGLLALYKSDLKGAVAYWRKAIAEYEEAGADFRIAQSIGNIAHVRERERNFLSAIALYDEALSILPGDQNRSLQVIFSINKASALQGYGLPNDALLVLSEVDETLMPEGASNDQIWLLSNVASIYRSVGNVSRAIAIQEEIVDLRRQINEGRAFILALLQLGEDYRTRGLEGDLERAIELHTEALKKSGDDRRRATANLELARDLVETKSFELARKHIERSLVHSELADAPNIRHQAALLFSRLPSEWVEDQIELVRVSAAAVTADDNLMVRARAKQSLAAVAKDDVERFQLLDSALEDVDAARQSVSNPWLSTHFGQYEYPIIEDYLRRLWSSKADAETQNAALALAQRAHATSFTRILAESGVFEVVEATHPWSLSGDLMDEQFEITESAVRQDMAIAKARSDDSRLRSFERTEAVDLIDLQRALPEDQGVIYYFIGSEFGIAWYITSGSVSSWEIPGRAEVRGVVDSINDAMSERGAEREFGVLLLLRYASEFLLPPNLDPNHSRLAIVADDALGAFPFAALPYRRDGKISYLVEQASITMLLGLQPLLETKAPYVEKKQPRVLFLGTNDPALPASAAEGQAIAANLPAAKVLTRVGSEAVRAISGSIAKDHEILHISAHASPASEAPDHANVQFGTDESSLLRVAQIYGFAPSAKRLAFLSACETSVGELIPGDGIHGLVRAALYNGAENVIATHWRVSDRASAVLVGRFYEAYALNAENAAEALREMQLSVLQESGALRHPSYWAAYSHFTR